MKTIPIKPIIRARRHAIDLLDSVADVFGARYSEFKRALDETWELFHYAQNSFATEDERVRYFVRGFMHILASLDGTPTETTPQAAALAA